MARADPPRTPRERCGFAFLPRDPATGRVMAVDALERFRAKCRFNPRTGCVEWIGGMTRGRGNTATYGSFWYDGRRWFAHRWAAVFVHGLDVGTETVGHCCPWTPDGNPNTLCVEHLAVQSLASNIAERNTRVAAANRAQQNADQRLFWLLTERGYEPADPTTDSALPTPEWPDFTPPEWLGLNIEEPTK